MIITGLSGSGKSTVLRALEDVGYFCVDNLPLDLLPPFLAMQYGASREGRRRSPWAWTCAPRAFCKTMRGSFAAWREQGFKLHLIFLEADEESLIRRFSQTRRQHPLADHESISQALREEIDDHGRSAAAWPTASSTLLLQCPPAAGVDQGRVLRPRSPANACGST